MNALFLEIMNFEREAASSGAENNIFKLKKLFINRIRKEFLHGDYIVWSLEKPNGYAGDYKIINDIYENSPRTSGFDRLFDNYFQMSAISIAVRNRKNDFKRFMRNFISNKGSKKIRIMSLGCGPCREIFELSEELSLSNVTFDCIDNDQRALDFSKSNLVNGIDANFIKENVVRFALKKDIKSYIGKEYDFIYSTGLFDYFDDRIIHRLIGNMRALLCSGGHDGYI